MSTRFFRAGIGTVIYNEQYQVALFERAQDPVGVWQFQQGGIDLGEEPNITLWRELMEEVGLSQGEIEQVDELPGWLAYQDLLASSDHSIQRIGQAHRWFFLKVKQDVTIDLTKATDNEFSDYRWTTFEDAIAQTHQFKRHVYTTLEDYFVSSIQKIPR